MKVSRLSNMDYNFVSFVDRGANLDIDGETGAHVLLYKRDTSEEDVAKDSAGFNLRGQQVKCIACSKMMDKTRATCPECGAKNMKQGVLHKADRIEKDDDMPQLDQMSEDELDVMLEEIVDALDADGDDTDDDLDGDDEDEDLDEDDGSDDEDTLTDDLDSEDADGSDTLGSSNNHSEEGDMGKTPETGIDKKALDADTLAYVEGLEAKVATLTKSDDTEDIYKGLSPAAIEVVKKSQADARDAQERIAKMEEAQDKVAYAAIAKSYNSLSINDDETKGTTTGDALRALAKADEKAYEEVTRLLKAANEQVSQSDLFKSLGTSRGGFAGADTSDKVAKRATEIAKDKGITIEKARAEAWTEFSAEYDAAVVKG